MAQQRNQEIIFASKPTEKPTEDNFRLQDCEFPQLSADGDVLAPPLCVMMMLMMVLQFLAKILYLSVDPYMRPKVQAGRRALGLLMAKRSVPWIMR